MGRRVSAQLSRRAAREERKLTASPKATPVASSSAEQVDTMHCETPWMKVSEEHRHWLSDEAHEVIAAVCPMQLMTLYQYHRKRSAVCWRARGSSGVRYTPGGRSTLCRDHSREQGSRRRNDNVRAHHVVCISSRAATSVGWRERTESRSKSAKKAQGEKRPPE